MNCAEYPELFIGDPTDVFRFEFIEASPALHLM
jgi:hypothetical protein